MHGVHESDAEDKQSLYGRQPLLTSWHFLPSERLEGKREGRREGRERGRPNANHFKGRLIEEDIISPFQFESFYAVIGLFPLALAPLFLSSSLLLSTVHFVLLRDVYQRLHLASSLSSSSIHSSEHAV
jgi:hypothetical protein